MGASYYVAADQDDNGEWSFTREQLTAVVERRWPGSAVVGPFPPNGVVELRIESDGLKTLITYFPQRQFLTFEDQDPLEYPLEIIYYILADLAPTVPAVWTSDSDGDVHPISIATGLESLIAGFAE